MRRQLREDPGKRQQYSQEILQLESRIFEIRNAKGRLIDASTPSSWSGCWPA